MPKDALVLGGRQAVVYMVRADRKDPKKQVVRPVPVRLGVAVGKDIQVIGEIQAGQQVVVEGNERLRPGMEVIARPVPPVPDAKTSKPTESQR